MENCFVIIFNASCIHICTIRVLTVAILDNNSASKQFDAVHSDVMSLVKI